MNKKFILIIGAFTLMVPGFFVFSYWYLGIFSHISHTGLKSFAVSVYAIEHSGDYNKTGEGVVKTQRLLQSYALECKPILIYFDSAITTGKPYLRSAGGCVTEKNLPGHVLNALKENKMKFYQIKIETGHTFTVYAQTAIALRKVWTEIARVTDKGEELRFPLVQLVHADGQNDFFIGAENAPPRIKQQN